MSRVEAMVGYWLRRLYSGSKEEERASLGCVRAVRACDKEAEASKRLSRRNESINQSGGEGEVQVTCDEAKKGLQTKFLQRSAQKEVRRVLETLEMVHQWFTGWLQVV